MHSTISTADTHETPPASQPQRRGPTPIGRRTIVGAIRCALQHLELLEHALHDRLPEDEFDIFKNPITTATSMLDDLAAGVEQDAENAAKDDFEPKVVEMPGTALNRTVTVADAIWSMCRDTEAYLNGARQALDDLREEMEETEALDEDAHAELHARCAKVLTSIRAAERNLDNMRDDIRDVKVPIRIYKAAPAIPRAEAAE